MTEKQKAWIDYYKQGHTATEAARLAGYRGKNHDVIGSQNLVKLKEFIKERDAILESPRIADMEGDQRLLDGNYPRRRARDERPTQSVRIASEGSRRFY